MRAALLSSLLALAPLTACTAPGWADDPAPRVRGPLASRTQHPLSLTFLALRPRRAVTQAEGTYGVAAESAYTTLYESRQGMGERAAFDGELWRGAARVRYGLGENTDVEAELALVYTTSGFLDDFVRAWHEFFLLPDGGRDEAVDGQYEMRLRQGGVTLYELEEDRLGFGDVPVIITHNLREEDEDGPALAARFGVELPLGSEDRGFGNGKIDAGTGVLLERSLGRFTLFGGLDYIYTNDASSFAGSAVEIDNLVTIEYGMEMRWNDRLSLLAQFLWNSPLTTDVDLEEINREIFDLGLGVAYDLEHGGMLHVAFYEDLVAATGPDFSLLIGASWGL